MTSRRIRVVVSDDGHRSAAAAAGLSRWLARLAPPRACGVVNVAVTSDARVRALNQRYRRKNFATDVLSFRSGGENTTESVPCLGDIVIARGMARRQARAAGHDERTELRILALHGLLHLLGYDHHRDDGLMARTERRLRLKGGLREGLIERSQP